LTVNRARDWRRIGIVLSVIWFLGFGGYTWTKEANRLQVSLLARTDLCYSILKSANDALPNIANQAQREKIYTESLARHEECGDRALRLMATDRDNFLWSSTPLLLAFDAATVAFGWLVVWLVILVVRWVQRGFASA
jgi:hypothetical protein